MLVLPIKRKKVESQRTLQRITLKTAEHSSRPKIMSLDRRLLNTSEIKIRSKHINERNGSKNSLRNLRTLDGIPRLSSQKSEFTS